MNLIDIGEKARAASRKVELLAAEKKSKALMEAAEALLDRSSEILSSNRIDMDEADKNNMATNMKDRLLLTEDRIKDMAQGLREISELKDPVGEVISKTDRPNGLIIEKRRVPMGVIGIIYESRPNVTSDAFGLCFKAGNAVILKGGSDAINSNIAITNVIREALKSCGAPEDAVQIITDTSRETAQEFMRLNGYVDVLIPRGGAGLIESVVKNSTVPVIETGTGNCHVYVDADADLDMAEAIVLNAKTQRTSVCNACESLLVHEDVAKHFLPGLSNKLMEKSVEMRCDEKASVLVDNSVPAVEDDWGKEYLDSIISIRIVKGVDEAINHINKYNTGHSETIVTNNSENAEKFLNEVDAACVYVNASTRFTDGFEFGFGGEIGISTQKLHARGPMGLTELTSYKYVVRGTGQTRE